MSEAELDESPDAADDVGGAIPASAKAVDRKWGGNGVHNPPILAVALTGAEGGRSHPPGGVVVGSGGESGVRCQSATNGVPPPLSAGAADEYPTDLFDVLEAWVFEHLRDTLHSDFLLSGHFQEYTRFLHVQHRPVLENDFILFRVLGRGGFGAVNGKTNTISLAAASSEDLKPYICR